MEKADVVIVGAGPAGSSAAYFLAKQGVDVILLEKNKLPRDKTCGDGIGPRSIAMLYKMGLGDWLKTGGYYRCDRARLFAPNGNYVEAGIPRADTPFPYFYIVPRMDFDHKLVETAEAAGSVVMTECKATSVVRSNGGVKGVTAIYRGEEVEIRAKALICADGTSGTFSQKTGISVVKPHAIAARAYYSNVKGLDDCIDIYVDEHIPEGYAWIFPMAGGRANIGLGISAPMLKKHDIDIRKLVDWFVTEKDTSPVDLSAAKQDCEVTGAWLRMGYGRHNTVADGIIMVGDAAGLISPLTGEGIAYALESGEYAAAVMSSALGKGDVSEQSLKAYQEHLNKNYYMDHRIYEIIRQTLSKNFLMNGFIGKGKRHSTLAHKFISIMMGTAKPSELLRPKMFKYFLF
ncbi:MAG: geranylgeranyl reductase family protein [Firmicutes bacterium]|nr:geranylgeranyl reductase family protein [Bacillota bacterium]